ncbi:MAG: hypothetical protein Q9218_005497 [Villophora microphyllina]
MVLTNARSTPVTLGIWKTADRCQIVRLCKAATPPPGTPIMRNCFPETPPDLQTDVEALHAITEPRLSLRAQVQKVNNVVGAAEALEEGSTRGQERKRKDRPPPPRTRPDVYTSPYSSYTENQAPQSGQQPGSSWYPAPNPNPMYSSFTSSSPVQQQQPGYSQLPPAQGPGYPQQQSGTYPPQTPTNGQQPTGSWGSPTPGMHHGSYSQGQNQSLSHGYPPHQAPHHSSPPPQGHSPPFSGGTYPPQANTYGSQLYNPNTHHSPPPLQGSSPPNSQGSPSQQYPYQPPSNNRSFSQNSYGSAVSAEEKCVHGQVIGQWYIKSKLTP